MEELNKQSIIDEEHLKLLVLFQRIYGIMVIVFSLLGIGYIFLLRFILSFLRNSPHLTYGNVIQSSPAEIINIYVIILVVIIVISLTIGVCNILSAQYIKKRKLRIFSIVIACVDCISFPLGTIIGVLTLVVLLRSSVIELYKPLKSIDLEIE